MGILYRSEKVHKNWEQDCLKRKSGRDKWLFQLILKSKKRTCRIEAHKMDVYNN